MIKAKLFAQPKRKNLYGNHCHCQLPALVTDAPVYASRSANGTILEVFEWTSQEAKAKAHENKVVMDCWNQFFGLAEIVPLSSLEEAKAPFASFERIA